MEVCDEGPLLETTWLGCSRPNLGRGLTATASREGMWREPSSDQVGVALTAETMKLLMLDTTPGAYSAEVTNVIVTPVQRTENSSDKGLQRAQGTCRIVVGGSGRGTRIMDL